MSGAPDLLAIHKTAKGGPTHEERSLEPCQMVLSAPYLQ